MPGWISDISAFRFAAAQLQLPVGELVRAEIHLSFGTKVIQAVVRNRNGAAGAEVFYLMGYPGHTNPYVSAGEELKMCLLRLQLEFPRGTPLFVIRPHISRNRALCRRDQVVCLMLTGSQADDVERSAKCSPDDNRYSAAFVQYPCRLVVYSCLQGRVNQWGKQHQTFRIA